VPEGPPGGLTLVVPTVHEPVEGTGLPDQREDVKLFCERSAIGSSNVFPVYVLRGRGPP
jgi:hypothetical protein